MSFELVNTLIKQAIVVFKNNKKIEYCDFLRFFYAKHRISSYGTAKNNKLRLLLYHNQTNQMLKEERQRVILNEVALHNRVLLTDISEVMDVSVDTVRRDVIQLDIEKKLQKVHGGAVSLGYANNTSQHEKVYALSQKTKIAEKAVKLLKNGNVILIHGGTTCVELARTIPANMSITCFTLSLPVAIELCKKPKLKVILIGGTLAKESQISSGGEAIHNLSRLKVDYGFIGTGYVDVTYGLTEFDWESVQVKMAVVQASKKTVLLTISEKLNSQNRYKTCELSDVSTMITELDSSHILLEEFRKSGVNIV